MKVCCCSLRTAFEGDSLNRVHVGTNDRDGEKCYWYAHSVPGPRAVSGFFYGSLILKKNDIRKCKVESLTARKYDFHLQILAGSSQRGCGSLFCAIVGWEGLFPN